MQGDYVSNNFRLVFVLLFFFFQAEDGIRDDLVTGVQTCALPICPAHGRPSCGPSARQRTWRFHCGASPGPGWQIGRASWRERVEISVVAGSLKKKNKMLHLI